MCTPQDFQVRELAFQFDTSGTLCFLLLLVETLNCLKILLSHVLRLRAC